jgi:inorganic pyrophosphatase
MKVTVETPKWSFVKYRMDGGVFRREFLSPLPTLFNSGFVAGTRAADGMPRDAIVLGPRLPQGAEVVVKDLGSVHFIDDGVEDDKMIASAGESPGWEDRFRIHLFFTAYALFKKARCIASGRDARRCRYEGISLHP